MKLLKKEIKTSHDIISFDELPFFYKTQLNDYINGFGAERALTYLKHIEKTREIRELIQTLLPIYKNTTSINSLLKVATTFCGYGECDETSQRAVMEFLAMGCEDNVNIIILSGKPCVANPNPNIVTDYYCHMVIVIGSLQGLYNSNPREFFLNLPDSHILFDSSLRLIGQANKTTEILASIFLHYQINNVAQAVEIKPSIPDRVAYGKEQLAKAKELSEIIMKQLNITPLKTNKDMFFSQPEKKYKKVESKPTSLLVGDDKLDWETCMQNYKRGPLG